MTADEEFDLATRPIWAVVCKHCAGKNQSYNYLEEETGRVMHKCKKCGYEKQLLVYVTEDHPEEEEKVLGENESEKSG